MTSAITDDPARRLAPPSPSPRSPPTPPPTPPHWRKPQHPQLPTHTIQRRTLFANMPTARNGNPSAPRPGIRSTNRSSPIRDTHADNLRVALPALLSGPSSAPGPPAPTLHVDAGSSPPTATGSTPGHPPGQQPRNRTEIAEKPAHYSVPRRAFFNPESNQSPKTFGARPTLTATSLFYSRPAINSNPKPRQTNIRHSNERGVVPEKESAQVSYDIDSILTRAKGWLRPTLPAARDPRRRLSGSPNRAES